MPRPSLREFFPASRRFVTAHPGWAGAALALVLSFAAFGATLRGGFVGDDFAYVGRFAALPWSDWPSLLVREWSGGVWGYPLPELRPVTALTLMLDASLWGANPFGFRLTNLLLHAATAGLVGWLAWRAAGRCLVGAGAAAALFALHPVHVEPVLWITGRVDVVATLAYLAGFVAFVRYRDGGGAGLLPWLWLAFAAAVFAKEFGLTLPAMALLADLVWLRRGRAWRATATWWPYVGWAVVAGGYFLCRRLALGGLATQAAFSGDGAHSAWALFCDRQLTYLGHLLPPAREHWLRDDLPAIAQHGGWLLPVVVLAAVLLAGWWTRFAPARAAVERPALWFFGFGWFVVATLPLIVTYVSARHLYLASAGLCVAVVVALRGTWARPAWVGGVGAALAVWLAVHGAPPVRAWARAADLSAQLGRETAAWAARLPADAVVLLDAPSMLGEGYVWAWAAPFALRPPFAPTDLTAHVTFLTLPDVWYYPGQWAAQPALERLRTAPGEVWLLRVNGESAPAAERLDPERVRAAAVRELPPGAKENEDWRRFLRALSAP